MNNQSQNPPNWKKGDIVVLHYEGCKDCITSIFEAEYDPKYCNTIFDDSSKDWHYGFRNCKEIRLATIEDVNRKIQYQTEIVEREQAILDKLLSFLMKVNRE
jgi:hypothetical protein